MNLIALLVIVAIIALVAAFVLPAAARQPNAEHRRKIGNANRTFHRRHIRKIYLAPLFIQRVLSYLPGRPVAQGEVQFANIGEGTFENGIRSYLPDATTSARYLLYKKGTDTDHCAICGAGEDPLGPSDDQADSTTTPIAIKLLGAVKGTVRVVTDGTVDDGEYVKAAANGKVTAAANGDLSFGRAIIPTETSKADGDVITIIPMAPAKYAF